MILPGRLALTTLGDLFGMCFRASVSGTLELTEDAGPVSGRAHRLHFQHGLIRGVETPLGAPPLGELLVSDGSLSRKQHFELMARLCGSPEKTTGQWIAESHWVQADTLRRAVHRQWCDRVAALFGLGDARVAYRITRAFVQSAIDAQPLPPEVFLYGKPRSRDRHAQQTAPRADAVPHHDLAHRDPAHIRALLSLGLTPQSSASDIKKAFHRMVSRLHPDRHLAAPPSQQDAARRRFEQVMNAYNTLMDMEAVA
jgi:DnaJ-domain-containing protein 1